jgi:hypothetical protein
MTIFVQIHDEAMQRHLNNTVTDECIAAVIYHQLPEQTQLQQILSDFRTDLGVEDIDRRRVHAIDLMVALSSRREDQHRKQRSHTAYQKLIKEESLDIEPFRFSVKT